MCLANELNRNNFNLYLHVANFGIYMYISILDDDDYVEKLIKFCPTKEDMELLKVKTLPYNVLEEKKSTLL